MTDYDNPQELGKYRKLYTDETGHKGPARDRFAHFMLRRFGPRDEQSDGYVRGWAQRWIEGDHFYKSDKESSKVLHEVYHEDLRGSALRAAFTGREVGSDE